MRLAGWGNYPRVEVRQLRARGKAEVVEAIGRSSSLIARGNGRAYGDSALNTQATLSMLSNDRILAFDPECGRITCEAGVLLSDLIAVYVPRGWFVPVTPGTKFVTLGGMVAADVHGKNHHRVGSFGDHVESLTLALADGSVVRCAADENETLFNATIGGMGLTGVILTVTFCLRPIESSLIRQKTIRARNLSEAMHVLEACRDSTYVVAWIDCLKKGRALGRSLIYCGEHAGADNFAGIDERVLKPVERKTRRVPFDLPRFTLNRLSVGAFNAARYRLGRPGTVLVDYDTFFYPLDAVGDWNRIYGRAGFVQYQCVMPKAASFAGMEALVQRIAASGKASFLAVLKLFGPGARRPLSFPMEGYTLALDFPADAETFALLTELDAVVADHGGRIYMAKDARAGAAMVRRGYPSLDAFQALRRRHDPAGKFSSVQSQRLGL